MNLNGQQPIGEFKDERIPDTCYNCANEIPRTQGVISHTGQTICNKCFALGLAVVLDAIAEADEEAAI